MASPIGMDDSFRRRCVAKTDELAVFTAGMVLAVTGLPANLCITLGCINAMAVPAEPFRLEAVVPYKSVLVKDDISNVGIKGSMTCASKEVESGGCCSLISISAISE